MEEVDSEAVVRVERILRTATQRSEGTDELAREHPLEVRIQGLPFAVLMRTPGHDEELTRGFLLSEGVVQKAAEIRSIRHCTEVNDTETSGQEIEDRVMQVRLSPESDFEPGRFRRNLVINSSCGLCGSQSLVQLLESRGASLSKNDACFDADAIKLFLDEMRSHQYLFDRTGGVHAAALFSSDGLCLVLREDVGRHNAVDKVIGWSTDRDIEISSCCLLVSGRISYEIVQKALVLGTPVLAAVSAPSSLAVELARSSNLTLAAFARADRLSIYSKPGRIR